MSHDIDVKLFRDPSDSESLRAAMPGTSGYFWQPDSLLGQFLSSALEHQRCAGEWE